MRRRTGYALAWLLAAPAAGGLARGFSGFGAALIFVPLASVGLGTRQAAPLMLVLEVLTVALLTPAAWRIADRREVGWLALGAAAGTPLGAAVLALADPLALRWGVALAILGLLFPPAIVGIYYVAQQVASLPQKLKTSFDPILGPVITQKLEEGDKPAVARQVRQVGFWIIAAQAAIALALGRARPGDTVVIAGKGHEQGQEFEDGRKIPFDDREVAREELRKLGTVV